MSAQAAALAALVAVAALAAQAVALAALAAIPVPWICMFIRSIHYLPLMAALSADFFSDLSLY